MGNTKNLRVVFMGTPAFAVDSLAAILEAGYPVTGVVTAPDKPAGRGLKWMESEIKTFALQHKLPLLQPDRLRDPDFVKALQAWEADLFVVVAFRMLPEVIWTMPPLGTINIHASLLPQFRGAAPINHAIIAGEAETGVSSFFIRQEIDTGKIIRQRKVAIQPEDDAGSLHDKLKTEGAILLIETLKLLEQGKAGGIEQDDCISGILLPAPKLNRAFCRINWEQPAQKVINHIRGLSPFPGAWTQMRIAESKEDVQLKVLRAGSYPDYLKLAPGEISSDGKKNLLIGCSDQPISIQSLQWPGKRRMDTSEFLPGFRDFENWTAY